MSDPAPPARPAGPGTPAAPTAAGRPLPASPRRSPAGADDAEVAGAGVPPRRAAFLDRDGVINVEHGYVHRWADFAFVPGSVAAMRLLHQAGYALVVVTNQSGMARGFYGEADYQALTAQLAATLEAEGAPLAGVYHCPHHPDGSVAALARECDCRKPAPGLLLRAQRELGLAMAESLLVGDKGSDARAARAAGVGRVFLVRSGHGLSGADEALADAVFDDLAGAVHRGLRLG